MRLCSLPVNCLAWSNPSLSSGSIVGLIVISKRAYTMGQLSGLLLPVSLSLHQPLPTQRSTGNLPTWAGSSGPFFLSSVSWGSHEFLCVLQEWSLCFPQSCGSTVIKLCWPSKSDSLGVPGPFARSSGWETWLGVQNLYNIRRTCLVLLFSSLWGTHPAGVGFDFIMIVPLLPSHCGFYYVFQCGVSSFGGFQCPPVNSCSKNSCILVLLQEEI